MGQRLQVWVLWYASMRRRGKNALVLDALPLGKIVLFSPPPRVQIHSSFIFLWHNLPRFKSVFLHACCSVSEIWFHHYSCG
jgi:hypothetical protein